MKEKLLNNLGLKVVSLVLAFIIWMAIVNISNPVVSGQSFTVPVEVRNGDILKNANLAYELGKESVTVNYAVRTRNSSLFRQSDFSAYVDLSDYNDVTGAVPVTIEVNKEKESMIVDGVVTAKPMVIHVNTEAIQNKKFDLKVGTAGEKEEGYALGLTTLSPDSVVVNGPESLIGQIASIGIEINVEGANADLEGDTSPIFYDANGKRLQELMANDKLTVKPETVHYNMAVLKAKTLNLNFEVKGTVADGYRFTGVECDVKSIAVVGTRSVLASVNTLSVADDKLSIEGATSDKVVQLDLSKYLPPSTTMAQDTEKEVTVTLKVEPLAARIYTLTLEDLARQGSNPNYEYTFSKDSVDVTVRGLKEDLDTLDKADLNAVLDLTDIEPGVHPGEIVFGVEDGFEIAGYSSFDVTVVDEDEVMSGPTGGQSESEQDAEASSPGTKAATETTAASGTTKKAAEE